ncbi:Sen15p TDEL_0B07180 [Torulaspora delbrueckii]|uniref:tRNA-splicing endonuclease subunit Sen15 domain-containing protein n=1 Tax=Torulaspora delbrueckii TaxID=4950 RepID=G8ZQF3_TORDE|nr:hypothetical protein TDEL_0B07180 [Torulaspora delbrueckii]CCE90847.1 hypothetical protein TDEL_0B07180 [Torulaspora delbrueckii]
MPIDGDAGSIVTLVRNNLAHYQLWADVVISDRTMAWRDQTLCLITGRPTQKLSHDDEDEIATEYVLPVEMSQYKGGYVTLECLDKVFDQLCPTTAKRLTLAIVNDDGTVAFYFVYKGLHKPKRN